MFAKVILVTILTSGSAISHSNIEVNDMDECKANGRAWVEQMIEKGYDRYTVDNKERPDWTEQDGNKWADYECVELPGKY